MLSRARIVVLLLLTVFYGPLMLWMAFPSKFYPKEHQKLEKESEKKISSDSLKRCSKEKTSIKTLKRGKVIVLFVSMAVVAIASFTIFTRLPQPDLIESELTESEPVVLPEIEKKHESPALPESANPFLFLLFTVFFISVVTIKFVILRRYSLDSSDRQHSLETRGSEIPPVSIKDDEFFSEVHEDVPSDEKRFILATYTKEEGIDCGEIPIVDLFFPHRDILRSMIHNSSTKTGSLAKHKYAENITLLYDTSRNIAFVNTTNAINVKHYIVVYQCRSEASSTIQVYIDNEPVGDRAKFFHIISSEAVKALGNSKLAESTVMAQFSADCCKHYTEFVEYILNTRSKASGD